MKFLTKRAARLRRGSTTAFFALGMIPMVGIMALSFEIGNVAVQYRRLQNFVDSKAVAALKEEFGNLAQDVEYDLFIDAPAGASIPNVTTTPEKGHWNFSPFNGTSAFTQTTSLSLAGNSVPAYRFEVDPFSVPLLFGPLFNVASVDIRAEAIAFAPRREVVIVQDVSGSMCTNPDGSWITPPCNAGARIGPAKAADQALVTQMASQDIPGDRVGVVAFNNGVVGTPLALTPLAGGGAGTVNNYINNLQADGGTDVGAGITAGNNLFSSNTPDRQIARIMIIVGDGPGGNGAGAAADAAEAAGADVYTIAFCNGANCNAANNFLAGLTRGIGTPSVAPNGPALTQILTDIVTAVPMRLVQ